MSIQEFKYNNYQDCRGSFSKFISSELLNAVPDFGQVKEIYSSKTFKYALRGMHFQHGRKKLSRFIWVSSGEIEDVTIDLRQGKTFGLVQTRLMSEDMNILIYVPWYFAHGFQVLSENATVNYVTNSDHDPEEESGIHFDSINHDWTKFPSQISERDSNFQSLEEFGGIVYE